MSALPGFTIGGSYDSAEEMEEDEAAQKILPLSEFLEKIRYRADIFNMDGESKLSTVESVCLLLAIASGLFMSTLEITKAVSDQFFPADKPLPTGSVKLTTQTVERSDRPSKMPPASNFAKRSLRASLSHAPSTHGGVGDANSRIARDKAFLMLSRAIAGKTGNAVGVGTALSGLESGLDVILQGINTLKQGSNGGIGRTPEPGIGTMPGYGVSGHFGDGDGQIGDLLDGLMAGDETPLVMKKRDNSDLLQMPKAQMTNIAAIVGGRSKSTIMATVLSNLPAIRFAYNRWLRKHPGHTGKLTLKFAIDEFGTVVYCEIDNGSLNDLELEREVVAIVKSWKFGKIDKPGDITEAIYPLVFSM